MSNKPRIYAYCDAGCKWETVHRDELNNIAAAGQITLDEKGLASVAALNKYKIFGDKKSVAIKDINVSFADNRLYTTAIVGDKIYAFSNSSINENIPQFASPLELQSNEYGSVKIKADIAVAIGTKIFCFNGTQIQVFDAVTLEVSTATATLQMAVDSLSYGVAIGHYIYIFREDTVQIINAANPNNVMAYEPIDLGDLMYAVPCVVEDKIYLFGGYNLSQSEDERYTNINVYDPATNTVTKLDAVLPRATKKIAPALFDNKIYLFGGESDTEIYKSVYVFDTATETITPHDVELPSLGSTFEAHCIGSQIFLVAISTGSILCFNDSTPNFAVMLKTTSGHEFVIQTGRYEDYRDYLFVEVLHLTTTGKELTVVYEVNGEQYEKTFYGYGITTYDATLEIKGAVKCLQVNTDAELTLVEKPTFSRNLANAISSATSFAQLKSACLAFLEDTAEAEQ